MIPRRDLIRWLSLAAAASLGCSEREEEQQLRPIKVSVGPYLAMSSFYLGLERGYFQDAGLRIETVDFGFSSQAIPLLAAGELDGILASPTAALANAVSRGAKCEL